MLGRRFVPRSGDGDVIVPAIAPAPEAAADRSVPRMLVSIWCLSGRRRLANAGWPLRAWTMLVEVDSEKELTLGAFTGLALKISG